MLVTFEGPMGMGKSMTATAMAYTENVNNGIKVISNNHYNFPYTHFDTKYFVENIETNELENCILVLDESYLLTDARSSSTKLNKLMTYFTAQTRKRNVDLYLCVHHIDVMDKRLRRAVDIRGTCRYRKEEPCQQCGGTGQAKAKNLLNLKNTKLALYRHDGESIPIMVSSKTSYHGRVTYKGRSLLDSKKLIIPEDKIVLRKELEDSEWAKFFGSFTPTNTNGEEETCPRCLGWGVSGWATTRFRDLRTAGPTRRIKVFGPAVFGLYATEERIPFTKKQMRINVEDL